MNGRVESFIDKRKAMEQAVSQIVSPNDSPEQKAEKLYARVQQLRNTSYEVLRSEQEKKRDKEKDAFNVEDKEVLLYDPSTFLVRTPTPSVMERRSPMTVKYA